MATDCEAWLNANPVGKFEWIFIARVSDLIAFEMFLGQCLRTICPYIWYLI